MSAATSARSPSAPTTSGAPGATAQSKPVVRLSSTTHALAGIDERDDHVASDIAGAAGDQDRHAVGPPKPSVIASSTAVLRKSAGAECTCSRPVTSRDAPYKSRGGGRRCPTACSSRPWRRWSSSSRICTALIGRRRRPDGRFFWVVAKAFAPARASASRRRRRHSGGGTALAGGAACGVDMARDRASGWHARRYDEIIDTQGLVALGADCALCTPAPRTVMTPRPFASAPRHGFYDVPHAGARAHSSRAIAC